MDALVKLYELPNTEEIMDYLSKDSIIIRHAMPYEKTTILNWVKNNFTQAWADECAAAFNLQPVSCLIALKDGDILGFACYECTQRNFFGPMGISGQQRNKGIGKALATESLSIMRHMGYAYAIVGDCDEAAEYYKKIVNADLILESAPGVYADRIAQT